MGNAVNQGSRVIAIARVHHQSSGFVEDQYVLVFEQNVEFHGFGNEFEGAHRVGELNGHHVAGFDLEIRLHRLSVDPDIAGLSGSLKPRPRHFGNQVGHEFVDAQRLLSGVGHQSVVLKQLFRAVVFFVNSRCHQSIINRANCPSAVVKMYVPDARPETSSRCVPAPTH